MKSSIIVFAIHIFCLLLILSKGQDKFIEKKITIDDNNIYINISVGEWGNKPFLISLYSPMILVFPANDNNTTRYNNTLGNDTSKNNISHILGPTNEYFNFIVKDGINIIFDENTEGNFNIGIIEGTNSNLNNNTELFGLFGLMRNFSNINNITISNFFLKQLKEQNLASNQIIYISNYYKNNKLLKEAKLMIGKFPEKFDNEIKKKEDLPFCYIYNNVSSINYFDCQISDIYIDEKIDNKEKSSSIQIDSYPLIGRFVEGDLQPIHLPEKLYDDFTKFFVNEKGCQNINNSQIVCNNIDNLNISIVMNKFKFILNKKTAWTDNGDNSTLNFVFDRNDNITILTSNFLGNFHRIYDNEKKKIYFVPVDNNIIKVTNIIWKYLTIIEIVIISFIIFFLISYMIRKKKNESVQKIENHLLEEIIDNDEKKNL